MITCFDVANYLLSQVDEDAGDLISNMKLQKLVYYAQGYHLALFDRPLFEETIEAWAHGPVVPELYRAFKKFGNSGIPIPQDVDFSNLDENTKDFLNEIYIVLGQFSAWKLRNMTHSEPPWKDVQGKPFPIISHESMKKYFKTRIKK
jgi:uncharacterized phage-associated protein